MNNPFEEILTELRELRAIILDMPVAKKGEQKEYIRGIHALAEFLNCSASTAQNLKNSGRIPYSQYGRLIMFDPDKVLDALEEHTKGKKK